MAEPKVVRKAMVTPSPAALSPSLFPSRLTGADVIEPPVYTRIIAFFHAGTQGACAAQEPAAAVETTSSTQCARADESWHLAATDRLTSAFQATVDAFPVVAGTLAPMPDGNYDIVLGPSCGASLTVQHHATTNIAALEATRFAPSALPAGLAAPEWMAGPADPLLQAHVTLFDDGLAVSVSLHHMVADGAAAFNLLQYWSDIARVGRRESAPEPVLDRGRLLALGRAASVTCAHPEYRVVLPEPQPAALSSGTAEAASTQAAACTLPSTAPAPASAFAAPPRPAPDLPLLRCGCFEFTPDALRRLKQAAAASLAGTDAAAGATRLSTNDAITALMWRAATRARGGASSSTTIGSGTQQGSSSGCLYAVDCRSRLEPPLPAGYFGNVNFVAFPRADVSALRTEPLGATALRIRRATEERTDAYARSVLALVEGAPSKRQVSFTADVYLGPDFVVSNWAKFGASVDFGFGTPIAYRSLPPAGFEGVSILLPRRDGGIDAFTGMQAAHWDCLAADAELAQFAEAH
jgi:hypothetical protein